LLHSHVLPDLVLTRPILRYSRKGLCPRTPDGSPDPGPLLAEYEQTPGRLDSRRWTMQPRDSARVELLHRLALYSTKLAKAFKEGNWPRFQRGAFFRQCLETAGFPPEQVSQLARYIEVEPDARTQPSTAADNATAESWRLTCQGWNARRDRSVRNGESARHFRASLRPEERAEYWLVAASKGRSLEGSTVREARLAVKLLREWEPVLRLPTVRRRLFRVYCAHLRQLTPGMRQKHLAMLLAFARMGSDPGTAS